MLNKAPMPSPELAMEIKEAGRSSKRLHWVPLADAAKPCQHPAPCVFVLLLELDRERKEGNLAESVYSWGTSGYFCWCSQIASLSPKV